jgi:ATP-dependent exoDNAse (exonuclease V) beta subunit
VTFAIYKSSAGSGKTFTLVKEYLTIALSDSAQNSRKFKKILAITFTNKAAGELKERVIKALVELSNSPGKRSTLARVLEDEMKLDGAELQRRSKNLLHEILHHYNDFSISTIDSFTHRVVRAFAHDLNLPQNFELELDAEEMTAEAVNVLMSRLVAKDSILELLRQFSESRVDEERGWQVDDELKKFTNHLLNEEGFLRLMKIRALEIEDFIGIYKKIRAAQDSFSKQIAQLSDEAIRYCNRFQLKAEDFYQGKKGIFNWFRKLNEEQDGITLLARNSYVTDTIINDRWLSASKKDQPEMQVHIRELAGIVRKLIALDADAALYITRKQIARNIFALALLREIDRIMEEFRTQDGIVHISEFNKRIAEIVNTEPVPFIFERIGERFDNFMIDEFQDTSSLQWLNLVPLIENGLASGHQSIVVGDGKQAIYRWRGGDIEQFNALPKLKDAEENPILREREKALGRNAQEVLLGSNYRSAAEIVSFNNMFFEQCANLLHSELQKIYHNAAQVAGSGKADGYIELQALELSKEEDKHADATLAAVIKLHTEGWAYRDITILVRKNDEGAVLAQLLTQHQIPIISNESLLLIHEPKVQLLAALLQWLEQKENKELMLEIITALTISNPEHHVSHEMLETGLRSSSSFAALLQQLVPELQFRELQLLSVYRRGEKLKQWLFGQSLNDTYVNFFLDELFRFTINRKSGKISFAEWWEKRSQKAAVGASEGIDAVRIMTIHKSKGLEFPVVIMPYVNWKHSFRLTDLWVDLNDPLVPELKVAVVNNTREMLLSSVEEAIVRENDKILLDNLNLLYVGMTRAERRLYVFYDDVTMKDDNITTASHVVKKALANLAITTEQGISTYGTPTAPTHDQEKTIASHALPYNKADNWEHQLKIYSRSAEEWDDNMQPRRMGKLLHYLLEQTLLLNDVNAALRKAIHLGKMTSEMQQELKNRLNEIFAMTDFKSILESGTCLPEVELIGTDGSILRPDLVIKKTNELIIIDYKTGEPNDSYKQQVEQYAARFRQMNYSSISCGILYTTKLQLQLWNY